MRALIITLLLYASVPNCCAIETGESAPEFTLNDLDGTPVTLSQYRGQYIYLDLWASWCVPCRASFPWMNSLRERFPTLKVIAVNLDKKRSDLDRFLEKLPGNFLILVDPEGTVPGLYLPKGMPTSYLIDPTGRVHSVHSGFRESTKAALEQHFTTLFGGKP